MRRRSRKTVAAPAALALVAGWLSASPAVSQESQAAGILSGTTEVLDATGINGGSGITTTVQVAPNTGGLTPGTGEGGSTTPPPGTGGSGASDPGAGTPATGEPAPPGSVPGLSGGFPGGFPGGSLGGQPGGGSMPGGPMPGYGFGTPPRADNIAQLIANAMARNPDISVAEAKVRSAQTELDRTRLDVSRQVVDTMQSIRFGQKEIEIAKAQVVQTKEQQKAAKVRHENGSSPISEVTAANVAAREAELALIKAEASLEATIATLDYLIGGQGVPGGMGMMPGMGGFGSGGTNTGVGLSGDGGVSGVIVFEKQDGSAGGGASPAEGSAVPGTSTDSPPSARGGNVDPDTKPTGTDSTGAGGAGSTRIVAHDLVVRSYEATYHERLRKKLAEPTTIDFVETPLADVMRYLDDLHGITNVIIDSKLPDERVLGEQPITLKLERVPLSAALKAIEDTGNLQFVVTEYGLRVTTKDVKIEESTPLRQFLRPAPTNVLYFGAMGGGSTGGPAGTVVEVPAGGSDAIAPEKEKPGTPGANDPQPRSR